MKTLHLMAYVIISGCGALAAFAQEAKAPSDNELRSAYCVAVLKQQVPWMQEIARTADTAARREQESERQQESNPQTSTLAAMTPKDREALQQAKAAVVQGREKLLAMLHEDLTKLGTAQSRLNDYLLPRMAALTQPGNQATLSLAALVMAMNRGDADWREFMAKGANTDKAAATRMRACKDPNWLPF
jgi:hypothetical protein